MKETILKSFIFVTALLSCSISFSADNKFANSLQECELLAVGAMASKSSTLIWSASALGCLVEKCAKI